MTPKQLHEEMVEWLELLMEYATGKKKWDTGGIWVCESHPLLPSEHMGYSFDCKCGAPGMPPHTPPTAEATT